MKNVYDNGYYLLGQVHNVIKYLRNNSQTSDMEEIIFEIVKELEEEYYTNDIVAIYYENPMGYTIEKWSIKDIVKEEN